MSTKPTTKPEWASGVSAAIVEPGGAKKALGWIVEKPPHQFFNWLQYWTNQWIDYFEDKTDELQTELDQEESDRAAAVAAEAATRSAADTTLQNNINSEATTRGNADTLLGNRILSIFDAIVGAGSQCTDATIAAAITRLSAGARILVMDSFALASTVAMSKANMEIVLRPGVIISAGAATTGFTVTAAGCKIVGGKISGFTNGIDVQSGGDRFMARDIWFASNTNDVNDSLDLASVVGCV